MAKKVLPSPALLRQLLNYDPFTGALQWESRIAVLFPSDSEKRSEHLCKVWNARYAGKEAMTALRNGYRTGGIFGRTEYAHRVAWAIQTGAWPPGQIDHVDGNRQNNAMNNLRVVDKAVNSRNQARRITNTSGFTGVTASKGRWAARISTGRKNHHLGTFDTPEEAAARRKEGDLAFGFHPNHGRFT